MGKDLKQAERHLQPPANANHREAQKALGDLQYVHKDYREALAWWLKAANNGYAPAQWSLATMHLQGEGTEKNVAEWFRWALRAANQGHQQAQLGVTQSYDSGTGTRTDFVEAYRWSMIAASGPNKDVAGKGLAIQEYLEEDLTEKEIAQGKRLAVEWKPSRNALPRRRENCGARSPMQSACISPLSSRSPVPPLHQVPSTPLARA